MGHPRAGTELHPRERKLDSGWGYREFSHTQPPGRKISQESPTLTAHRPSFPTCLFHPRRVHLLCHLDSPSAASLPYLGLQEQTGPEVSSSMAATGFLLGVLSFLCALSHLEESLTGQQASCSPVLRDHNNPRGKQTQASPNRFSSHRMISRS